MARAQLLLGPQLLNSVGLFLLLTLQSILSSILYLHDLPLPPYSTVRSASAVDVYAYAYVDVDDIAVSPVSSSYPSVGSETSSANYFYAPAFRAESPWLCSI